MRPGREHDTTALPEHAQMLPALHESTGETCVLADLGYEGQAATPVLPINKPADGALTDDQRQLNWLHAYARARAEQANSLLKTTFKALRRVSLPPDIIGAIAAALVLLHIEHGRMTTPSHEPLLGKAR